ncbi:MAG: hypothetical protein J1E16_07050 [Muribaculaceae bacterium]|nr:hypothetical protein [Muribaculaceae bacterium]
MKEIKSKEQIAQDIVSPKNEFKGYTIEEIRFQRALLAMEADFSKTKLIKSWNNLQKFNPLSPSSTSIPGKAGSIALKLVNGLSYMDYVMLGWSLFSGARKVFSFFKKGKKK